MPSDPKNEKTDSVRLKALLRIKRAERPDTQFWDRFDRELHQRMLQTLVRKEPWYAQVGRALSGRFAQSVGVGAAALLVAIFLVRPALLPEFAEPAGNGASQLASTSVEASSDGQVAAVLTVESPRGPQGTGDMAADGASAVSGRDYKIDAILAEESAKKGGFTREFGLDRIEVASYDRGVYSADSVSSRVFSQPGVASLVY